MVLANLGKYGDQWIYHEPYKTGEKPNIFQSLLEDLKDPSNSNYKLVIQFKAFHPKQYWVYIEKPNWIVGCEYRFRIIKILEKDYSKDWTEIQSFGKEKGITVPDLTKPVDPFVLRAREILSEQLEKDNLVESANRVKKGDPSIYNVTIKAIVRALREG